MSSVCVCVCLSILLMNLQIGFHGSCYARIALPCPVLPFSTSTRFLSIHEATIIFRANLEINKIFNFNFHFISFLSHTSSSFQLSNEPCHLICYKYLNHFSGSFPFSFARQLFHTHLLSFSLHSSLSFIDLRRGERD